MKNSSLNKIAAITLVILTVFSLMPGIVFADGDTDPLHDEGAPTGGGTSFSITIQDDIAATGSLKAVVTGGESPVSYKWFIESDMLETTVSSLYIARDGARRIYRVKAVFSDGSESEFSEAFQVPYYDKVLNGDFENVKLPYNTLIWNAETEKYQQVYFNDKLPNGTPGLYWKSTSSSGYVFVNPYPKAHLDATTGYYDNQYLDLSGNDGDFDFGVVYQDILTEPGTTYYWSLEHAATGKGYEGLDDRMTRMAGVFIMPASVADTLVKSNYYWYEQDLPNYLQKKIVNVYNTEGQNDMHAYWGAYTVPEGQYITRFILAPLKETYIREGNIVDNVVFGKDIKSDFHACYKFESADGSVLPEELEKYLPADPAYYKLGDKVLLKGSRFYPEVSTDGKTWSFDGWSCAPYTLSYDQDSGMQYIVADKTVPNFVGKWKWRLTDFYIHYYDDAEFKTDDGTLYDNGAYHINDEVTLKDAGEHTPQNYTLIGWVPAEMTADGIAVSDSAKRKFGAENINLSDSGNNVLGSYAEVEKIRKDGESYSYYFYEPGEKVKAADSDIYMMVVWAETADISATLTYRASEGGSVDASSEYAVFYGNKVTGSTAAANKGRSFDKWTCGNDTVSTEATLTQTVIDSYAKAEGLYKDTTFVAHFKKNEYTWTINHYESGTTKILAPADSAKAPFKSSIDAADYIKTNITGFTYDSISKPTIVIDTKNNTANIYYSRNSYNIYYYINGVKAHTDIFKYEEDVTTQPDAALKGYVFSKWDWNGTADGLGSAPDKMPAEDINVYGSFAEIIDITVKGNTLKDEYNGSKYTVTGFTVTANGVSAKTLPASFTVELKADKKAQAEGTDTAVYQMKLTEDDFTVTNTDTRSYSIGTVTVIDGSLEITRKAVTVKADDKSKTRYETDPAFTAKTDGVLKGEQIKFTINRESGETPGTYSIIASGEKIQGNYKVSFFNGTFTINPIYTPEPTPAPTSKPNKDKTDENTSSDYTVAFKDIDRDRTIHASETKAAKIGDVIRAADEVITIDGYTYTRASAETLAVTATGNTLTLYYSADEEDAPIIIEENQTPKADKKNHALRYIIGAAALLGIGIFILAVSRKKNKERA